jgi:multiple antibiotic resistance protein
VLEFFLQSFLTLLVVMDPIGLIPAFLSMAGTRSSADRQRMAQKAVIVAGIVILLFAFAGQVLLNYLGISFEAFRTAGGVLLFLIALDMVFARHSGARETDEEEAEARAREDISVFPLAIPLIAGPGTLASVMILTGKTTTLEGDAVVIGTAFLVLMLCFLALRASGFLIRVFRKTGVNVISRVLGVLLAALAIQYVADGVRLLLKIGV